MASGPGSVVRPNACLVGWPDAKPVHPAHGTHASACVPTWSSYVFFDGMDERWWKRGSRRGRRPPEFASTSLSACPLACHRPAATARREAPSAGPARGSLRDSHANRAVAPVPGAGTRPPRQEGRRNGLLQSRAGREDQRVAVHSRRARLCEVAMRQSSVRNVGALRQGQRRGLTWPVSFPVGAIAV